MRPTKARKPVNYVASTVYITPAQHDYLRRRAYEEKRTAAGIIRELVAREMEKEGEGGPMKL